MRHIFILDGRSKSLRGSRVSPAIVRVFLLLFCFVACSLFNSVNAQTDKVKKTEQREQLLLQLDANMNSFLSAVRNKREQNLQQLEELRVELEKFQSRKVNKKTRAMDEQIEQSLLRKITNLENKDREYQKMEEEAIALLSDLENLPYAGVLRTRSQSDNVAHGQEAGNGEEIFFTERMAQSEEYQEYISKMGGGNNTQHEQFRSELDANAVAYLATIQTNREQNQQQLVELRTELEQHQAKKPNKKTQAMDEQIEQSLERKIANLENKDKEYQKMEEEAVVFLSEVENRSSNTQRSKSQTGNVAQNQAKTPPRTQSLGSANNTTANNNNIQQNEQLLTKLDADVSYLATIQTKREQNQQQLVEVRLELEQHQAKKPNKKTRTADEQIEQSLERKLTNLERKDREFQKIEEEAVANISLVMESIAQSQQSNNVARTSQS